MRSGREALLIRTCKGRWRRCPEAVWARELGKINVKYMFGADFLLPRRVREKGIEGGALPAPLRRAVERPRDGCLRTARAETAFRLPPESTRRPQLDP